MFSKLYIRRNNHNRIYYATFPNYYIPTNYGLRRYKRYKLTPFIFNYCGVMFDPFRIS